MENKNKSSEKTTDLSSNISWASVKMKHQQKNKSDNKIIESKFNNRNTDRKLTIQPQIFRKNFVPVLKPIEVNLIPTKLRLNKLDLKNKRNKKNSNTVLSWSSCPCSENDSEIDYKLNLSNDSFDNSESSELLNNVNNNNNNKNGFKNIRKRFIQLKDDSMQRALTKKNINNRKLSKQFNYLEDQILSEEEKEENEQNMKIYKDSSDEENFSLDLYEDDYILINYPKKPYDDNNNKKTKLKQTKSHNYVNNSIKNYKTTINDDKFKINDDNKKRNSIYSLSILDTLKNKIKMDN